MPTPRQNENRSDFISRCIPQLRSEGREQNESIAICHSLWKQDKKHQGKVNNE